MSRRDQLRLDKALDQAEVEPSPMGLTLTALAFSGRPLPSKAYSITLPQSTNCVAFGKFPSVSMTSAFLTVPAADGTCLAKNDSNLVFVNTAHVYSGQFPHLGRPTFTALGSLTGSITTGIEPTAEDAARLENRAEILVRGNFEKVVHPKPEALTRVRTMLSELVDEGPNDVLDGTFITITGGGSYQLEWEDNERYLELVIPANGPVEVLFEEESTSGNMLIEPQDCAKFVASYVGAGSGGLLTSA